jgi:hypothetical protein
MILAIAGMGTDAPILPIAPAAPVPGRLLSGAHERYRRICMNKIFGNAATAFAHAAGKPVSFMLAALSVVVWLASGPFLVSRIRGSWLLTPVPAQKYILGERS